MERSESCSLWQPFRAKTEKISSSLGRHYLERDFMVRAGPIIGIWKKTKPMRTGGSPNPDLVGGNLSRGLTELSRKKKEDKVIHALPTR